MDNASKALVMAGAILIAVMLISLGVLLFNRAQDMANQSISGVNTNLITAYNSKFQAYEGKNKGASEIRTLIHAVETHNINTEEVGQYGKITLKSTTKTADVKDSKYYTVVVDIGKSDATAKAKGCVDQITITAQTAYVTN